MSLDIVFMGTPDFALPCLESLINSTHNIVGVFTQPDRPRGRGKRVSYSDVKVMALEHDLEIYQPTNFKDGSALEILKELAPDLMVVVAYGNILPQEVLDVPPLGCINVHGSLLPELRGAAPIQWSILNGDSKTGITTMYMDKGMDTGDIILQEETPIGEKETAGELFDRLAPMGAKVLMETIDRIVGETAPRTPQDSSKATYAPMMSRKLSPIDFSRTATEVVNWIRGLNPWPSAETNLDGDRIIVHAAEIAEGNGNPGEIINPKELIVACGQDAVKITEIQHEGRKRVDGVSFSNGRRLTLGEKFIFPS